MSHEFGTAVLLILAGDKVTYTMEHNRMVMKLLFHRRYFGGFVFIIIFSIDNITQDTDFSMKICCLSHTVAVRKWKTELDREYEF